MPSQITHLPVIAELLEIWMGYRLLLERVWVGAEEYSSGTGNTDQTKARFYVLSLSQ